MEEIAKSAKPDWQPDGKIPNDRRAMYTPLYGLTDFYHLFTNRQLVALSTFSDLVLQAREKAFEDAIASGLKKNGERLRDGGSNAETYADAIATYLGLGVSRLSDICNSLCMWENTKTQVDTFSHVNYSNALGLCGTKCI